MRRVRAVPGVAEEREGAGSILGFLRECEGLSRSSGSILDGEDRGELENVRLDDLGLVRYGDVCSDFALPFALPFASFGWGLGLGALETVALSVGRICKLGTMAAVRPPIVRNSIAACVPSFCETRNVMSHSTLCES